MFKLSIKRIYHTGTCYNNHVVCTSMSEGHLPPVRTGTGRLFQGLSHLDNPYLYPLLEHIDLIEGALLLGTFLCETEKKASRYKHLPFRWIQAILVLYGWATCNTKFPLQWLITWTPPNNTLGFLRLLFLLIAQPQWEIWMERWSHVHPSSWFKVYGADWTPQRDE